MHDIRAIRDNPAAFVSGWSSRGVDQETAEDDVDILLEIDTNLREAQTKGQEALARRNDLSRAVGAAMKVGDVDQASKLKVQVERLKAFISECDDAESRLSAALRSLLAELPNVPAGDVPAGEDESENKEISHWGTPNSGGMTVDHADLGEALGLLDFEAAAKMSGSRFAVLKGGLARLERAIGQFMLDVQTGEHGYLEVNPPYLVRDEAMFGTAQLPKFGSDLFRALSTDWESIRERSKKQSLEATADLRRELDAISLEVSAGEYGRAGRIPDIMEQIQAKDLFAGIDLFVLGDRSQFSTEHWLIPTAEVSLTNLVREQILSEDELATPIRYTALTPCFRAEAGSAGRDTRGLIRQHQFHKVEMVSITRPEDSEAEHERMVRCAEAVLEKLNLPYRRMLLCKGDMGFSAKKTFDLEVWLPSQGTYREISSCSNCGDFQARRMEARFKRAGEKKTEFVHTLNGSGLAVGRTLVAVMENYQEADGRIAVPDALVPYMGGVTHVGG
ncbi:serine--tRNA ligase [Brevundimonas sp.]|uniref:serine--tRNA ligase n=1 Tax=Brevundimonas sp. TaxID=1871086 RepID=UPI002730BDE8|nr:serine--tRNA ligase [Brevundimonas sp.]MDP1912591.1 serine--tRNA ligase [Brevundimonas sp.]